MRHPCAAAGIEAKGVGAVRRFVRSAKDGAARVLSIEEPLEHREWIVGGDAMRVGAGANRHTDLASGHDRRLPANLFVYVALDDVVTGVVHRVLHGPADPKRLHALKRPWRRVVEVSNGPPQWGDRKLPVHALPDAQDLVEICVA